MIKRIYTAEFASGYTAVMTVSLSGMDIVWSPRQPTISMKFISDYREWRNTCLADFANETGDMAELAE